MDEVVKVAEDKFSEIVELFRKQAAKSFDDGAEWATDFYKVGIPETEVKKREAGSYSEGYNLGKTKGYKEGWTKGWEKGFDDHRRIQCLRTLPVVNK
jgi:flagellar biosynthesis/type III secretory pathway protein FliH